MHAAQQAVGEKGEQGASRCGGSRGRHPRPRPAESLGELIPPTSPPSNPRSWSSALLSEGLVERFIPIDIAEADTVLERCLDVSGPSAILPPLCLLPPSLRCHSPTRAASHLRCLACLTLCLTPNRY